MVNPPIYDNEAEQAVFGSILDCGAKEATNRIF